MAVPLSPGQYNETTSVAFCSPQNSDGDKQKDFNCCSANCMQRDLFISACQLHLVTALLQPMEAIFNIPQQELIFLSTAPALYSLKFIPSPGDISAAVQDLVLDGSLSDNTRLCSNPLLWNILPPIFLSPIAKERLAYRSMILWATFLPNQHISFFFWQRVPRRVGPPPTTILPSHGHAIVTDISESHLYVRKQYSLRDFIMVNYEA